MNRDEDVPRLMYADYLLDSDSEVDKMYGEFIKVSIELSNHNKLTQPRKDNKLVGVVVDNGMSILDTMKWYHISVELLEKQDEILHKLQSLNIPNNIYGYIPQSRVSFSRGFVEKIQVDCSKFFNVIPKIVWHPSMGIPCPITAHPIKYIIVRRNGTNRRANDISIRPIIKIKSKYNIDIKFIDTGESI
jgi:uncharacterized protein (TIGR02996 family)